MKSKFLKIIILLVGVAYIASACEFDHKEMKQNYEKENHSYITAAKTGVDFINTDSIKHFTVSVFHFVPNLTVFVSASFTWFIADYKPPQRLYLRYSVFLI